MTDTALRILLKKLSPNSTCVGWDYKDYEYEIDWFMECDDELQAVIMRNFDGKHFGEYISKSILPIANRRNSNAMLEKAMRNKGMKINNQK